MSKRSFYEQVAFSKELNPFHSLFFLDEIKDLLQKLSIEDTEFGNNLDYLCYMISSNDIYKKFCTWLKNYANNKDLSYYYLGIISLVNRDTILLSRIHKHCIAKDAVIDPIKELKHEIQTSNGNTIHISCQTKNYKTEKGKQEIDLVWETKNCIVIGECKCIRYPFASRDIYNSTKIINKAVEQVKIKSQFLEDNKKSFTKLNLQKKIVRVVITNYPLYTGIIIDGVPVIDFRILESYIQLGYNGQGISQSGNMRELNKTYFYNNEDEFSENIEKYLIKPDVVETLKEYFTTSYRNMDVFPNLKLNLEDLYGTGKEINLPKE